MTLALLACATAALGLTLLVVAGPAYRIGVLSLPSAFALLRWGAYAGVAGMLVGLLAGRLAYRRGAKVGTLLASLAFLGGVAAFGIPFEWQRGARNVPPIHDITTALEDPPTFEAVIPLRAEAPNTLERSPALAEQQRQGYPDLAPVVLPVPPDSGLRSRAGCGARSGMADRDGRQGIRTHRSHRHDTMVRLPG